MPSSAAWRTGHLDTLLRSGVEIASSGLDTSFCRKSAFVMHHLSIGLFTLRTPSLQLPLSAAPLLREQTLGPTSSLHFCVQVLTASYVYMLID